MREILNVELLEDISLSKYTTYKCGGKALGMFYPNDINDLIVILKYLKENKLKFKLLGKGSNVIFNNELYKGYIINLERFNSLEIYGRTIRVGAGFSLPRLSIKASLLGLTDLEFASGIPGTIGGAIYMNAGAYNSDMKNIVKTVKVLTPDFTIKEMTNNECDFSYRESFFTKNKDYIVLEIVLELNYGDKEEIMSLINDRKNRRIASQPLDYPSAGSVFRNPEGDSAGRIIESLGLKGKCINDACVSNKHANFIINTGRATGEDIKKLIKLVQKEVKDKTGIELKIEQEFVE